MDFSPFFWIQQWPVEVTFYSKESNTLAEHSSRGALSFETTSYPVVQWFGPADLLGKSQTVSSQDNFKVGKFHCREGEGYLRRMGIFFCVLQLWTSLSFYLFSSISSYSLFFTSLLPVHYAVRQLSPCSSYICIQQIVRNLIISNVAWGFPSTCFIASD